MKWNEYFRIIQIDNPALEHEDTRSLTFDLTTPYFLYEIVDPDGKVLGTYKDEPFARKQAKYKFKRLQAKLETILLRS